jgi:putative acetyltransferase
MWITPLERPTASFYTASTPSGLALISYRWGMRLRPYDSKDEDALVDVWFEGWRSVGLDHPVVTRDDLATRVPKEVEGRWTVTVAEQDRRIVGFLALALKERRLDQLFIQPGVQGCGVGGSLFNIAIVQLPEGFWLSTQLGNHRAREFYERRGMVLNRTEGTLGNERIIYEMHCEIPPIAKV